MFKRLMRSTFMTTLIGWLISAYMVLIKYSTRWEVENFEQAAQVIQGKDGLIALTWHSRFMMLNAAWKKQYALPHVLISRSKDGAIVAKTTQFLGLKTIRGSARKIGSERAKGGAQAGSAIIEAINQKGCVVITPDGPRGPRQQLGNGPLRLAKLTGAPILPCLFSVSNRKQFKSWDRFVLPLPFGRGKIIWGTPIYVDPDDDAIAIEVIRQKIETEMNTRLRQADIAMGHIPTEPQ